LTGYFLGEVITLDETSLPEDVLSRDNGVKVFLDQVLLGRDHRVRLNLLLA